MTLALKYIPAILLFVMALAIPLIMLAIAGKTGPRQPSPRKMTPFECGNDTPGAGQTKMSVKFYLTAILFVVFDVEVVFMYPWAALFKGLGWVGFASMLGFIVALLVALAYCWKKGALEWER